MFVGRDYEVAKLEELYAEDKFQMVVIYGRRRIGKTTLISHFMQGKRGLFFTAQEANDTVNLQSFSRHIYRFFNLPDQIGSFLNWESAFEFIAERAQQEKFILAFDEFPYAAGANTALCSILQQMIDHKLKFGKLFLILCGSQVSFMETEVLGYHSPLFGRRTAQFPINSLDYYDAAKFLPNYSNQEKLALYACVGGTPHYLVQVRQDESIEQNLLRLYFDISGYLYNEPFMLLRQELREPAVYNSIITAMATGANRINEIADKLQMPNNSVSTYLRTLLNLHLVKRICPFNDNFAKSKKTQYLIADNCYLFWYKFVFPLQGEIENGNGQLAAKYTVFGEAFADYIGKPPFEEVCLQFLRRMNNKQKLPFEGIMFGTWWGNDSKLKQQSDVDVVMANRFTGQLLLGECKWRNEFKDVQEIEKLLDKGRLFPEYKECYYAFFSKIPYSKEALNLAEQHKNLLLYTVDDLFLI